MISGFPRSTDLWSPHADPFLELLDLISQCVDEVEEPLGMVVNHVVDDHADGVVVPAGQLSR